MSETFAVDPGSEVDVARELTPHVALERVRMIVNPASGSVGPGAADAARALLAEYPLDDVEVIELEPGAFSEGIAAALDAKPDLLIILAGDGTAGTVASSIGDDGPLIATLPGGTMNMLPKALYGTTDWQKALRETLEQGEVRHVSGGEVEGRTFFCAAIFGAPALWAPAREAVREGDWRLAWLHGRRAFRRMFGGRLRYRLDGGPTRRAEALAVITPLISRVMDADRGLEAAAMSPSGAADAFRLAAHALFDDWRHDPAVKTQTVREARLDARSRIPAVVDGEPLRLSSEAVVRFCPRAFRALAPNLEHAGVEA
jgi:diacylglycerol kinase family enzyme